MNSTTNQPKSNPVQWTTDIGHFHVSALGPDALVSVAPPTDELPLWVDHVISNGTPLHDDPQALLDRYYSELLAKGLTRFPTPVGIQFWKHYLYNGSVYVISFPEVITISRTGKTIYQQVF